MVSLWFRAALVGREWLEGVRFHLASGRIAQIAAGVAPGAEDERHGIAVPGLANVHSHAFQRAMAGLSEVAGPSADDFWTWREIMYRFVDRLDPDDVEAIGAFTYAEMLEGGYTRVGEFHYLHNAPDGRSYTDVAELTHRIAAAAAATGIGLTLLPVLYAHSNFGGLAPRHGQRRFILDLDQFARVLAASRGAAARLPGARVGVAPHSLRAVTASELAAAVALAGTDPIHIHAAEQVREVEDCLAWSGRRPVEWLLEHAGLDARWCVVHATHVSEVETRGLAACGAVAGLCPLTEANLGDGIFPARDYLEAGGAFGIGSDSNVLIDAAAELRALEYAQRLSRRGRNILASSAQRSTGRRIFEAALAGGAQALGAESPLLQEGGAADIVSLDPEHPALWCQRGDGMLDGWIFTARDRAVDCVWRAGAKLVAGGRHIAREAIERRYRRTLERLLS
jgi:formiminoglutamate deiminase